MFVLLSAALASPCTSVVSIEAFEESVDAAWSGHVEGGNAEATRDAARASQAQIPCLAGPLSPSTAARFHRLRALASQAAGDQEGARAAALTAHRLDPDASAAWSEAYLLWGDWIADPPTPRKVEFATSLAAAVYSDGVVGARRFAGQPVVLQIFDTEGRSTAGAWVASREPTPLWVQFPEIECPGPVQVDAVVADADRAGRAFQSLDVDGFDAALQDVAAGLPCVNALLSPVDAASIHRLEGIRLFTRGATVGAVRSFQEAQVLDPAFVPDAGLIPPETALDQYWRRAGTAASPPWFPLDVPDGVVTWVDGLRTDQTPATLPTILQVTDGQGTLLRTQYIPAAVPVPTLEALGVVNEEDTLRAFSPAMRVYKELEAQRRRRSRRAPVLALGAALLVGSGAAFVANTSYATAFEDPTAARGELPRYRRLANRSATLSLTFFVAGAGTVIGSEMIPF